MKNTFITSEKISLLELSLIAENVIDLQRQMENLRVLTFFTGKILKKDYVMIRIEYKNQVYKFVYDYNWTLKIKTLELYNVIDKEYKTLGIRKIFDKYDITSLIVILKGMIKEFIDKE
jgi:hypothetical protein